MEQLKEQEQLQKRFRDLADQSYRQGIYTFSDFLSLADQDAYHRIERELSYAHPILFGGYPGAERQMLRFGSEEELGYEAAFPFVCIHVEPLSLKFAEDLGHRDFLGALMNQGIERACLGDLLISNKSAYLFCEEQIADYICENLDKVRHTNVKCRPVEDVGALGEILQEEPEELQISIASARVDAVVAKVYHLSREESLALFRSGLVFVNGRLMENNSKQLIGGETVNARGYGKFEFVGEPHMSRKGKLVATIKKYR